MKRIGRSLIRSSMIVFVQTGSDGTNFVERHLKTLILKIDIPPSIGDGSDETSAL